MHVIHRRLLSTVAQKNVRKCAPVPNRALVAVTGSDAKQLLNGIITTQVPWPPSGGFYSAFLHAQGRIQYDVFLWPIPETGSQKGGYLIEHDPRLSEVPPMLSLLKRYMLRSKVTIRDVSNEYDIWAAWGHGHEEPERRWRYGNRGAVEPVWESPSAWHVEENIIRDLRSVGMGHRFLVPKGAQPKIAETHEVQTEEQYTIHRIIHGVPEGSIDLPPMQALAMNSNLDLMGGIDFRKGCYVGQELTVRTYHTGVIRKRIFPVLLYEQNHGPRSPPTSDASIPALDSMDITTSATDPTLRPNRKGSANRLLTCLQGVGLALLRVQHVDAVQKGQLTMHVEVGDRVYQLRHWIPSWWPIQSFDEGLQE